MAKQSVRRAGSTPRPPNNLKQFRIEEGVDRSDLARTADVADKTVERVEAGRESRMTTLYKILNGLNALRNQNRRAVDYSFQEVFPNHAGGIESDR